MEVPVKINIQNAPKIEENFSYNNQEYQLKIISSNETLIIRIEKNAIEDLSEYYENKYKIQDLYSVNKFFRQFDTINEAFKGLENNKIIIIEKSNLEAYSINVENSILYLKVNLYLMTGETQLVNIKLNKIKYTEAEVNTKLKEYIKYIKSIPGVNDLITSYEKLINQINFSNVKSKIIPKLEDFKFIYEELCKKLNKTKLKFIQKFNVLKDGDSSKEFHKKCDNIGPNLSIIKTKENIIFGGFTMNNWSCGTTNKKDDLAFLFNFQNKKIYNIKKGDNAIYCSNSLLINYYNGKGNYSSLYVNNNCLKEKGLTCPKSDTSYNFSKNYELNNGNQYFYVSEMEIYEVQ